MLKNLWDYRFFIISSIKNEFKSRFIRSKLGGFWMVLHPFAQVLIYALVLSTVLKAKLPGIESQYAYAIYLMAGMVAWNLFNDIMGRSINIFIDNGNLIKKMSFPKLTLPIIVIGSSFVNFLLLFISMFIIFTVLGHFSLSYLYYLPLLILNVLLLAIGLGLFLGVLNVFVRDIGQIMTIILQFWFWLTPIVYPINMIPESYHSLFYLNPIVGLIEGFHSILVYNSAPNLNLLIYPLSLAICSLIISLILYKKANNEIADVL